MNSRRSGIAGFQAAFGCGTVSAMHFRIAGLLLFFAVTACTGNPRDLGITGPVSSPPAAVVEPATPEAMPEPARGGDRYAPSMVPSPNGGRYWGYN